MSPRGPRTLLYLKCQCHYNIKGLRVGLVGPLLRTVWGPSGPMLKFSGWNPGYLYLFWHTGNALITTTENSPQIRLLVGCFREYVLMFYVSTNYAAHQRLIYCLLLGDIFSNRLHDIMWYNLMLYAGIIHIWDIRIVVRVFFFNYSVSLKIWKHFLSLYFEKKVIYILFGILFGYGTCLTDRHENWPPRIFWPQP